MILEYCKATLRALGPPELNRLGPRFGISDLAHDQPMGLGELSSFRSWHCIDNLTLAEEGKETHPFSTVSALVGSI